MKSIDLLAVLEYGHDLQRPSRQMGFFFTILRLTCVQHTHAVSRCTVWAKQQMLYTTWKQSGAQTYD